MTGNILGSPFFWIGVYLVGYIVAIAVISIAGMQTKVENKIPRPLTRIFILLTFIVPPVILPITEGPKMTIPTPVALTVGILLLGINFIIKIVAQRQIGVSPALKSKAKVITAGIYSVVRNPLYLSNGLLAVGMAILFNSLYAFPFSILYTFLYLPIIYFEEKDLSKKYGKEYEKYKRKVRWKMIPNVF